MLKKLISVIALVLCVVMVFGACGEKTGTNGTNGTNGTSKISGIRGVDNDGNLIKVEKVAAPDYKSGTMTLEEFENTYRPYTDWRIYEIRTTKSDVKPAAGGTAYYVSNNGKAKNDGLTPETAVSKFINISGKIKSGDVVYFERGSEFYGTMAINQEGVTLAAYGEGKAPVFHMHSESAAGEGKWEETDVPNVYKYHEKIMNDIGVIAFDDVLCSYKAFYTGTKGSKSKKKVNSYKELDDDLQFYHDFSRKDLYLYSEKGNPGEVYSTVELAPGGALITIKANNVTVDGLCIKNAGFGISATTTDASETVRGLTVRNCEFGWIGGYSKTDGDSGRLGNAIEIWGGATDFTVENCYFYQVYDAAATFQYSSNNTAGEAENILFKNNVFDYCNYSVEYFMKTKGVENTKNFVIDGNLSWYAGEGLCSQRPDITTSAHIKSWGGLTMAKQVKVTNNLFAIGFRQLCQTIDKTKLGAAYDNNIYVQTKGKRMVVNSPATDYFKMDDNVKTNIETQLGDKNATIITISK